MTGLSSSHSSLDRFIVSHLSKKDYVRALAESGSQRYQIAFCVCADLPLADNTAIMSVQIFQRILQSNNMAFSGMVDLVHKAGHGSRFTASCRTCNQYHTLGKISSGHDIFRNMEDVGIGQFKSNHTDHSCQGTSLSVSVHTESGQSGDRKREIIISCIQERINISVISQLIDLPDQCIRICWHKSFSVSRKLAVNFYR